MTKFDRLYYRLMKEESRRKVELDSLLQDAYVFVDDAKEFAEIYAQEAHDDYMSIRRYINRSLIVTKSKNPRLFNIIEQALQGISEEDLYKYLDYPDETILEKDEDDLFGNNGKTKKVKNKYQAVVRIIRDSSDLSLIHYVIYKKERNKPFKQFEDEELLRGSRKVPSLAPKN